MKSLEEQIEVMQHAFDGGSILKLRLNDKVESLIITDTADIKFNWTENDYEIYFSPDIKFIKTFDNGSIQDFPDQATMDADETPYVIKGEYYSLGPREIEALKEAELLPK